MTGNLLADQTSPYLLQHKDNPVHWRPWGPDALAEAAASDKPLLVSVGYSACHWCHVMAHESFEDAETAALINDLYIPVKVDREERPDIDNWLQRIPGILGKPGGWPLTAFLTPKGEPFWAGTYFPKNEGFGLPAFRTVLSDLAGAYRSNPDQMSGNINRINQEMEQAWYQNRRGTLDMRKLDRVAIAIAQRSDSFYGGIVGAPKFPNPAELELLFRGYLRTGRSQFLELSLVWADAMCRGGIYDHVGGGFARYALDEEWLVPHFEKMLYDNAAILDVLCLLWQHGRQPVLKQKIEETIAFVLREMTVEGGGFASSLDADSEGEEGKFYLWSESEIDRVLSATPADKFKRAYGIAAGGNFTHQGQPTGLNILHRVPQLPDVTEADELMFVEQRRLLFKARENRVRPERDDKILVDWNGMMIASLANAGVVFGQNAWLEAAKKAFAFVCENLSEGDLLYQSYRLGRRLHPALADGYAHMARAALTLWEATADKSYLERAQAWTRTLDEQFWDIVQGGYVFSKNTDLPASVRVRSAQDGPLPSANGVMLGVVGRLYYATLNPAYGERANTLIQAFAGDVAATFMQMSTYLNNFEFIASCLEIVVVGPSGDPRTQAMVGAVRAKSLPNRLLVQVGPEEALPAGHPAAGKTMQDGAPTAYVCGARMCSPPVTNPAILTQVLQLPDNSPFRRAPGMPDRLADGSRVPG